MTTFDQFRADAKARHDYSDMIQVRYAHPNGEDFDAWVSGEEIMGRLDTQARERLIKSFSQKNWRQAQDAAREEIEKGKRKIGRHLKDRLADIVSDQIGGNIFGDALADNIRDADSNIDPHDREKAMWQDRLRDEAFRAILFRLAWIDLEGVLPDEGETAELDDWI